MDALRSVTRYVRQIALPEIGPAGQERIVAARVALVGRDLAAETAARYLAAAGVGTLRLVGGRHEWEADLRGSNPDVVVEHEPRPAQGPAWLEALEGASAVVRSGFDDDAMLHAAVRLGIPAITMRANTDDATVDVLSFRKHGPCPHAPLDVPVAAAVSTPDGAASVVAGTVAASEALHVLVGHGGDARARHLRLPLDGGDATTQELPWTPECFLCGGTGKEMSFS
jgi:molybdopterin/thiamine biosynthesis adenylyltransferase